jgi:predicted nucleic acid-binding protein
VGDRPGDVLLVNPPVVADRFDELLATASAGSAIRACHDFSGGVAAVSLGIGWHDCLIAATAIRLGVSVATLNNGQLRAIPGLLVHRAY